MRIAILGGGAAGLVAGWLLQHKHQVEIFEKAEILGGHVRTLNRNVVCPALPTDVCIENGVLGFHSASYPHCIALMQKLQIPLIDDRPSARLYTGHAQYPVGIKFLLRTTTPLNVLRKVQDVFRVVAMVKAYRYFDEALDSLLVRTAPDAAIGKLLSTNGTLRTLQKAILMLSFSTPYEAVEDLPAGLCLPYLVSLRQRDWCYVEGGVYRYLEAILHAFNGTVHTNAQVRQVVRSATGVELIFHNGGQRAFDKVIFSVPPGQILRMLTDPTDAELRRFNPWKDRTFVTLAHTDDQIYKGFDRVTRTPMDCFIDAQRDMAGYNTPMNHAYRLGETTQYAFAYQMEKRIRPETILDRQAHLVPGYSGTAWHTREEIRATNGEHHCYFAGAWMGNGLHEGAISSAIEVATRLGAQW